MKEIKVPFGPQHPALPEPVHFTISLEGETVTGVDLSLGYNHRGIEKGFESRDFFKSIYLAERVCGLCLPGNTEIILKNGDIVKIGEFVNKNLIENDGCVPVNPPSNVLSWKDNTSTMSKVTNVVRFQAPKTLLEIKTNYGPVLRFTHAHPIMIDTRKGPQFVRAEELKEGDMLFSPRKIEISSDISLNIIDYFSEDFMINLDGMTYEKIKKEAEEKYGSLKELAKKTKISVWRIWRMKSRFRIWELKRICKELNLNWSNVILGVKQVSRPGVTVKFKKFQINEEMMYVLGLIASDGYFGKIRYNKKDLNHRIGFVNKEKELIKRVRGFHEYWFPEKTLDEGIIKSDTPRIRISNPVLSFVASGLGLGSLKDEKRDIKQIFKLPENLIASFLAGYFDGDGTCSSAKTDLGIKIDTCDKLAAKRLQLLLKRIGIGSYIYSGRSGGFKNSIKYRVTINNKLDTLKFIEKIKPQHPKKQKIFQEIKEHYKNSNTFSSRFQLAPKKCGFLLGKLRKNYNIILRNKSDRKNLRSIEKGKNAMKWTIRKYLKEMKEKIPKDDKDLIKLEKFLSDDFFLVSIKEIKEVKCKDNFVFDLTVGGVHNFIPEGAFVVSNCGHSHSSCFVNGMEKIIGVKVPERAQYIRTLVFELSRIHSHYLYAAMCAYELGYDTLFHLMFRDRESVMEILEEMTGNRVHYVINNFGGVRRDFKMNTGIRERLEILKKKTKHNIKYFNKESSILKRTRGRGRISHKDALDLGIVGPNARASGIPMDTREDDPYFSYDDVKFKIVTGNGGDILTRINMRLYETLESLKIIDQLVEKIPRGKIKVPVSFAKIKKAEIATRVEAPRGELLYYIRTSSGKNSPDRVKIRTPTYATMNAIPTLLTGLRLADVSIAIMSIDPCMSCTDRVTIVDTDTGKSKTITGEELRNVK